MKVIIAGGRDFKDYKMLVERCEAILTNQKREQLVIVTGKAKGADLLGEKYADQHNLLVKEFPADWEAHGKSAGPIRNNEMADYADALIAFWDQKSKGTKHMIETAKKKGLNVRVIFY